MKKLSLVIISILIITVCACCLFACEDKDEEAVKVDYITAEVVSGTVYHVGDVFDTSTIKVTAVLTDGTKTVITSDAGLVYDKSGLALDNRGRFTDSEKNVLVVSFLNHTPVTVTLTIDKKVA